MKYLLIPIDWPPLNSEAREIRLIEIQPGKDGDPITARFIVTSLNSPVLYECLSYAWGDLELINSLEVDGQTLGIAANLHLALLNLRLLDDSRLTC